MRKLWKKIAVIATIAVTALLAGCSSEEKISEGSDATRVIADGAGRQVEIPKKVDSIVCLNVSTLRYTCYMDAQDMVIGVEDYEQTKEISRLYSYKNADLFAKLPVVGSNGKAYPEEIIKAAPDVIMISPFGEDNADELQEKTGIPVVVIPGSDKMLDEGAYETFRIMGEVYGKEERAKELADYMDAVKADLDARTADIPEEEKPSVYVGGVSFKGIHGFEGTEAGYGPLEMIHAKNLANRTEQKGPFNMDLEQILEWNPDVIFVDFDGLALINENYAANPEYYQQLKAVQEGNVYSQISFRAYASNLETALADTYYAGCVLYPEQFKDVDPEKKAGEIFGKILGKDFYGDLKENGYEFRPVQIGK